MKKEALNTILTVAMLMVFILLVVLLINSTIFKIEVRAANFQDVPETHWAHDHIIQMQAYGIINGYEDGTFKPENELKTGEFIKMVATVVYPNYEFKTPKSGEHWSRQYVDSLSSYYLNKWEYDSAKLESYITREEAAQIIWRLYNTDDKDLEVNKNNEYVNKYSDAEEISKESYRFYIDCCTKYGLINGFEDGTFRPQGTLTRAQAAKLLRLVMGV